MTSNCLVNPNISRMCMYLYYSNCNSKYTKQKANIFKQLSQCVHTTILEDLMLIWFKADTLTRIRIYTATIWWGMKTSVPPVLRSINTTAFKLIKQTQRLNCEVKFSSQTLVCCFTRFSFGVTHES